MKVKNPWHPDGLKIKIHGSKLLAMTGEINLSCGSDYCSPNTAFISFVNISLKTNRLWLMTIALEPAHNWYIKVHCGIPCHVSGTTLSKCLLWGTFEATVFVLKMKKSRSTRRERNLENYRQCSCGEYFYTYIMAWNFDCACFKRLSSRKQQLPRNFFLLW